MDPLTAVLICAVIFFALVFGGLALYLVKSKQKEDGKVKSITKLLFITTQIAALGWVSVSYLIALYATIRLSQPFPVVELSQQAITTVLGVNALKVIENIFEHNDGKILGTSHPQQQDTE